MRVCQDPVEEKAKAVEEEEDMAEEDMVEVGDMVDTVDTDPVGDGVEVLGGLREDISHRLQLMGRGMDLTTGRMTCHLKKKNSFYWITKHILRMNSGMSRIG